MILINSEGKEVQKGDKFITFRGEKCTIASWAQPHKPSSTGRVYVDFAEGYSGEYFPSVIDCRFVDECDYAVGAV